MCLVYSPSEQKVKIRVTVTGVMTTIALVGILSSCSDSSGPSEPVDVVGPARLISGPTHMAAVTRDVPLATSQSASATIGIFGGQIRLPDVGFTLVVPAFAVTTPTTFTVTAVAGSEVAYEFEPHGSQFSVPLLATQVLEGTSVSQPGLSGVLYAGYFTDLSALDQLGGTALVDEVLRVSIDRLLGRATFPITHFSGYLLGTGESDPHDGEGMH
jgi:hypothetical protein